MLQSRFSSVRLTMAPRRFAETARQSGRVESRRSRTSTASCQAARASEERSAETVVVGKVLNGPVAFRPGLKVQLLLA